jgi:osmotically-inducible protein OsmY
MKCNARAAAIAALALALAACDQARDSVPSIEVAVAKEILTPVTDPDAALTEKVREALGIGGVPAYGVEVVVEQGRVTLFGYVDSTAERKRFEISAAGVVGVRSVDNRIVVDPGA